MPFSDDKKSPTSEKDGLKKTQSFLGPYLEGAPVKRIWYPDFRIGLLPAAFPSQSTGTVALVAGFVPGHSGGAVLDLHQLPSLP